MALKPEAGVLGGLAVASVVFAIHSQATPSQADIQALPADNKDIDTAERKATWLSAGVVAGISLLAKDPTIFVIGSAMTIGMAFWTRHSNAVQPLTGLVMTPAETSSAGSANTGPAMEETEPYQMFQGSDFDR